MCSATFYYRNENGLVVNFIVEHAGKWVGNEVKLSDTKVDESIKFCNGGRLPETNAHPRKDWFAKLHTAPKVTTRCFPKSRLVETQSRLVRTLRRSTR